MDRQFVKDMAQAVEDKLPDGYAFIVIATPFGKEGDGRTVYTANCDRSEAIKLLKELLFRWGQSEDWMKHVK